MVPITGRTETDVRQQLQGVALKLKSLKKHIAKAARRREEPLALRRHRRRHAKPYACDVAWRIWALRQDAGMVSFEPDFMNQNYNCVPDFVESADNARTWQMGMAVAALEKNLTVQWCYATPTDILAALEEAVFHPVTQLGLGRDLLGEPTVCAAGEQSEPVIHSRPSARSIHSILPPRVGAYR